MSTFSTRTLAALAFERGEEFDPALTLPSGPLVEDLALLAGARVLVCELSPTERRRRRQRERRAACPAMRDEIALDDVVSGARVASRRPS
jgi:hypothetical protein